MESGGGRLDVDARYEMLRKSISGTMSQFRMARDRKTGQIVGLKVLDDEKTACPQICLPRSKNVQKKLPRSVETIENVAFGEGQAAEADALMRRP